MSEISAEILLRPTRIGFLVSPTDLTSIRKIMRICVCLWGGVYNPIIPVFKRAPKEWQLENYQQVKGIEITKGYIKFFEPDVYVEAQKGLLEDAGLGSLRNGSIFSKQVVNLKDFFEQEQGRNWAEPTFGMNIGDVLADVYKSEKRFVQRDVRESLFIKPDLGSSASEALFGIYPLANSLKYMERNYKDVYQPETIRSDPSAWRRVYIGGADSPLKATRHGLEAQRHWHHNLLVYVFDATKPTDLIDLWNLRLEPRPVLPVPIHWIKELREDICRVLEEEYRPIVGNPNGLMHSATIEFGRSIAKEHAEEIIGDLHIDLPRGALQVKYWRNAIWVEHRDENIHRDSRLKIIAKEWRTNLTLNEGQNLSATFQTLAPKFSQQYRGGEWRWVNALKIVYQSNDQIVATALPFNTFNRTWPRMGLGNEEVLIGSEGWVFPQRFDDLGQYVSFMNSEGAIVSYLKHIGVKAEVSEPGHIARQMLEQLGGFWGIQIISDEDTLRLLNKMAGSIRRLSNERDTVEESYELSTATLKQWSDIFSKRDPKSFLSRNGLKFLTEKNVIRLGLQTECPHCHAKNWHSLTQIDYQVNCDRCLKEYKFPQAELAERNKNFTYRVIGPFTARDYGRGSYSVLMTLRILSQLNSFSSEMTFCTSLKLSFDGVEAEVDFFAWRDAEKLGNDFKRNPRLIIGEAKSFGLRDLIKKKDLAKLKLVAGKLEGAVVVISVLRDHFTTSEIKLLKDFVKWGRRVNHYGEPTNPVILFTGNELMTTNNFFEKWKDLGGIHEEFADYRHTHNLLNLADASQQIYLKVPSFHQEREEYWKNRASKRKVISKALAHKNDS